MFLLVQPREEEQADEPFVVKLKCLIKRCARVFTRKLFQDNCPLLTPYPLISSLWTIPTQTFLTLIGPTPHNFHLEQF